MADAEAARKFFDPTASGRSSPRGWTRMSDLFRQYTAGQLEALIPATFFFAPFVDSYKRFRVFDSAVTDLERRRYFEMA